MNNFSYSKAPLSLRALISFFLVVVGVGYGLGLLNIYNNVGFSYTGVVVHYRGDAPPEFAMAKLVQEHHVHLFGMSILFLLIGYLFTLTSLPEVPKAFFVSAPFVGMILDFAGLWWMVFLSPVFAWFPIIFGGVMAISFFMLIARPLYEMWVLPIFVKKHGDNLPWHLK